MSVLPIVSKVFERLIQVQMNSHIVHFLSPYLCGYRQGFSAQHALMTLIENWKKTLDQKGFGGAILMDLSKAFDTLNHELLLTKLNAYGYDKNSLKSIHNYLSDRYFRTKIYGKFSS